MLLFTDIKNGIGNVFSEILVGLYLRRRMSRLVEEEVRYVGYLTDRVMRGHLTVYREEHSSLPPPFDMRKVFPSIQFSDSIPEGTKIFDYTGEIDDGLLSERSTDTVFVVNYITQMLHSLENDRSLLSELSFCPSIRTYTEGKYSPRDCLAVHVRIFQKGDYMTVRLPDLEWYERAIEKAVAENSPREIFLISGMATAASHDHPMISLLLEKYGARHVYDEPYYVDMSLISLCGSKVVTNSSFSLFSSLMEIDGKKVYAPQCLMDEFRVVGSVLPEMEIV